VTGKPKSPVLGCPACESGGFAHAYRVAAKHKCDLTQTDDAHAKLDALARKAARLPGGAASVLESDARSLRAGIARIEDSIIDSRSNRAIREGQAAIANLRKRLEEVEQEIEALPAEAKTDPAQIVQQCEAALEAARATGKPEAVAMAAVALASARARGADVQEQRMAMQKSVTKAAANTFSTLGGELVGAFDALVERVRSLTNDKVLTEAPELLDRAAIRSAWKAGTELAEAGPMLGYTLSLGEFEEVIPDHVLPWVREAVRFNTPMAAA
jgi:hypothetical protein